MGTAFQHSSRHHHIRRQAVYKAVVSSLGRYCVTASRGSSMSAQVSLRRPQHPKKSKRRVRHARNAARHPDSPGSPGLYFCYRPKALTAIARWTSSPHLGGLFLKQSTVKLYPHGFQSIGSTQVVWLASLHMSCRSTISFWKPASPVN